MRVPRRVVSLFDHRASLEKRLDDADVIRTGLFVHHSPGCLPEHGATPHVLEFQRGAAGNQQLDHIYVPAKRCVVKGALPVPVLRRHIDSGLEQETNDLTATAQGRIHRRQMPLMLAPNLRGGAVAPEEARHDVELPHGTRGTKIEARAPRWSRNSAASACPLQMAALTGVSPVPPSDRCSMSAPCSSSISTVSANQLASADHCSPSACAHVGNVRSLCVVGPCGPGAMCSDLR